MLIDKCEIAAGDQVKLLCFCEAKGL
jgi:hypothetical protein